ncbi:hypothetical protein BLOT_016164 [Blomia tropicalis]|nr:hypothetical protein BLOT_016164 [Blomia tropicalis]
MATEQMVNLSRSLQTELYETANRLATPGKGILAADESVTTIGKRFEENGIANNEVTRRQYRQMLIDNEQLSQYISGVILHEETIGQNDDKGKPLIESLKSKSIIAGIKVDKGLVPLLGTNGESATQGLDDLKQRCDQFYKAGCRFAKWRAVLKIGENEPSQTAIIENATGLARYASICQQSGLVPIVEPEVLSDGNHNVGKCQSVSEKVYCAVFKALNDFNVLLEGILLKPNMVTPGHDCQQKSSPNEVALHTITALSRTVPPAVPGIMFLSGGQSEEEATDNLDAINRVNAKKPWILSFSFGRALQTSALAVWAGKRENIDKAQQELLNRAKANSLASMGKYTVGSIPTSFNATKSNYVAKHSY